MKTKMTSTNSYFRTLADLRLLELSSMDALSIFRRFAREPLGCSTTDSETSAAPE